MPRQPEHGQAKFRKILCSLVRFFSTVFFSSLLRHGKMVQSAIYLRQANYSAYVDICRKVVGLCVNTFPQGSLRPRGELQVLQKFSNPPPFCPISIFFAPVQTHVFVPTVFQIHSNINTPHIKSQDSESLRISTLFTPGEYLFAHLTNGVYVRVHINKRQ